MTKTTSPTTSSGAELSASERLALEVSGEQPASTPEFRPWLALDRRARAALVRAMGAFVPALTAYMADETAQPEPEPEPDPDAPAENAGKAAWTAYAETLGLTVTPRMTRAAIRTAVAEHRATTTPDVPVDKVTDLARTFERAADLMELAAGSQDVLRTVAVDLDGFDRWATTVDDVTLIETFMRYERTTQLGEAWRSRS